MQSFLTEELSAAEASVVTCFVRRCPPDEPVDFFRMPAAPKAVGIANSAGEAAWDTAGAEAGSLSTGVIEGAAGRFAAAVDDGEL